MEYRNTPPADGSGSSAPLDLERKPLILCESNIPQLREVYMQNRSSILHRIAPEIRTMILEFAVTEDFIEPLPVVEGDSSVNKFIWGDFKYRRGIVDGRKGAFRVPTGWLANVSLRLTCRQFYHELGDIFYEVNTFMFGDAKLCQHYLSALPVEKRHKIRNIGLDLTDLPPATWTFFMRTLSPRFRTSRSRHILHLLLPNCPRLERLSIVVGTRPSRRGVVLNPQRMTSTSSHHMDHCTPFDYEYRNLLWRQGNRNPARIFGETSLLLKGLEDTLTNPDIEHFSLPVPQLEFLIAASPTMVVRVNGGTIHRSNSDAPRYIKQFEDDLENTNEQFKRLYNSMIQDPKIKERFSRIKANRDLLIEETFLTKIGPRPDLTNLKPLVPNRVETQGGGQPTTSETASKYDKNGLLVISTSDIKISILKILWKGLEIVCAVTIERPTFKEHSFEPISRFASWDWISELSRHFNGPLNSSYQLSTLPRWSRTLLEYPSPKDIDAALRATGLLNGDEAPGHILQAWETLVNNQDRVMADLHKTMEKA